jgi:hypothetical protein
MEAIGFETEAEAASVIGPTDIDEDMDKEVADATVDVLELESVEPYDRVVDVPVEDPVSVPVEVLTFPYL